MSIKYNGKTVASNYKISASTTASDTKAGPIKIATEQELKDTTNNKVAVTPYLLNKALSSINRGLKIGRIGIGFINESQQQERYLNGQVIIQDQFESFTTWVKDLIKLYPNLSCTNEEFETACTLSAYGQCGKFVVDNNAGSIRLPKVVNVQGLFDLTQAGLTVEAGLPNITGTFTGRGHASGNTAYGGSLQTSQVTGAFNFQIQGSSASGSGAGEGSSGIKFDLMTFDASRSNTTYGNSTTVQEEAVQYPYYIVVAIGVETPVDVTRELELNNPFFFGMSQYFEVEPNNISWLKSVGQWNSKAIYTDYYDWILTNVNNNKKGFVTNKMYGYAENNGAIFMLTTPTPQIGQPVYGYGTNIYLGVVEALVENGFVSTYLETQNQSYRTATVYRNSQYDQTGIIDDYHWCIDTVNETFRLPLLDGSENIVDYNNGQTFAMSTNFTAPANGIINATVNGYGGSDAWYWTINGGVKHYFGGNSGGVYPITLLVSKGDVINIVGTSDTENGFWFYPFKGNGSLYFYVGETVQNANLVNVGRIEEKLSNKLDARDVKAYITETYQNGTSWYRVYSDGWCEQGGQVNFPATITFLKPFANTNYTPTYSMITDNNSGYEPVVIYDKADKTMKIHQLTKNYSGVASWYACGYIA